MKIIIHTDGGSRGNPGPAGAGIVLKDIQGNIIQAQGYFLGETTSNVAEYTGVIRSLEVARIQQATHVDLYSDSQLVVRQIHGEYAVRSPQIIPLYEQTLDLLDQFQSWDVIHIRRKQNKHADSLANQAMDAKENITES